MSNTYPSLTKRRKRRRRRRMFLLNFDHPLTVLYIILFRMQHLKTLWWMPHWHFPPPRSLSVHCTVKPSNITGFYQSRATYCVPIPLSRDFILINRGFWAEMSHRLHPVRELFPLITSLMVVRAHRFYEPKCKGMDKVSCAKRHRNVMTLGEKTELLDQLALGENLASVRSAITGSMIASRTFPHYTLPHW